MNYNPRYTFSQGEFTLKTKAYYTLMAFVLCLPKLSLAADCSPFSKPSLDRLSCEDSTAARYFERMAKALQTLERVIPSGVRPAFRSHQNKWESYAEFWLAPASNTIAASSPRCSSPRAFVFQRMDSLEKTVSLIKETRPKSIDLCYDNAACLEPGASNGELICETLHLGIEGVPANAEQLILTLLGDWVARGHAFETRINKSTRNSEPCEVVTEKSMIEYLRGGFVTVRTRQGDTCNPQKSQEQVQTFDLRSGRSLKIKDFAQSPIELLNLLRKRKEAEVLQALLGYQLYGDKSRPRIEPNECSGLPFASLDDVNVHVTSDGLRVNNLFQKTTPDTAPCQFKVEDSLSPTSIVQLLKGRTSPASGMVKYLR